MSSPYVPYLVYGTVRNSLGYVSASTPVEIITSLGTMMCSTNSAGLFVADLASIGYVSGETIIINSHDMFNNESSVDTHVISTSPYIVEISLSVRDTAQRLTTGYAVRSVLHSVGNSPITDDNPLPIKSTDILAGYILSAGDDDTRTYGYVDIEGR